MNFRSALFLGAFLLDFENDKPELTSSLYRRLTEVVLADEASAEAVLTDKALADEDVASGAVGRGSLASKEAAAASEERRAGAMAGSVTRLGRCHFGSLGMGSSPLTRV